MSAGRRGVRIRVLVAWALCAATAALGARAAWQERAAEARAHGAYVGGAAIERAEVLVSRLAGALVAMQQPDGSFQPRGGATSSIERTASSALATAVLARTRRMGVGVDRDALREPIRQGLDWLRGEMGGDGAVGRVPDSLETRPYRVDATAATLLACVTVEDAPAVQAAERLGPALAAFAEDGLHGGWSRALAAMAVEATWRADRQAVFPQKDPLVVKGREVGPRRDIGDLTVAEAIVRQVRVRGPVFDTFPGEITQLVLEAPPVSAVEESTDMQAWWMRGWLARRSEAPGPWFEALLLALEEGGLEEDGHVPGSFYADAVLQTAAALGVVLEGFSP